MGHSLCETGAMDAKGICNEEDDKRTDKVESDVAVAAAHELALRENAWREKTEALEAVLREVREAASQEMSKREVLEKDFKAKVEALEADLKEARKVASCILTKYRVQGTRNAALQEELQLRIRTKEAALRLETDVIDQLLRESHGDESQARMWRDKALHNLANDLEWRVKAATFERERDDAREAATQAIARAEAWSSRASILEKDRDEARAAAKEASTKETAWRSRVIVLERAVMESLEGTTRALHARDERERSWRSRLDGIQRKLTESQTVERTLRDEKERVEKDFLAYTLCQMRDQFRR